MSKDAEKLEQALLIGDLASHIERWAAVVRNEKTGNSSFSKGLKLLAGCLKPHKSRPVSDLAKLQLEQCSSRRRESRKPPLELPGQLDSLNWDEIIEILDNELYQKKQLIELGQRRLGIPPSRLSRLKRTDAIASIRAAMDNERSLSAIEHHASLAGERRSA